MIAAAGLGSDDIVLEIGAGFGNLTQELAKIAKKVIAVEPDKRIFPALQKISTAQKNIIPVNDDVFKVNFEGGFPKIRRNKPKNGGNMDFRLQKHDYRIIANLPYQITSLVFRHFLEHGPRPKSMTVMVQKEMAERICANVGQKSILSLSVKLYSDPEIVFFVPKKDFFPVPEVDSAVVNLPDIRKKFDIDEKLFFRIVKIGFSSKRKKLANNLENGLDLGKNQIYLIFKSLHIYENARPQEIGLKTWVSLIDAISKI